MPTGHGCAIAVSSAPLEGIYIYVNSFSSRRTVPATTRYYWIILRLSMADDITVDNHAGVGSHGGVCRR
jgi:hypothetical protein